MASTKKEWSRFTLFLIFQKNGRGLKARSKPHLPTFFCSRCSDNLYIFYDYQIYELSLKGCGLVQNNNSEDKNVKAAKKIINKQAKKFVMTKLKAALVAFLLKPLLIAGAIILLATLAYFVVFEFTGTEKEYNPRIENKIEMDDDGIYKSSDEDMDDRNRIIRDFYTYYAFKSQWQINDKGELIDFDDPDAKHDQYNRESQFHLSPNMLYALDKIVFDNQFKYPDQFIKPVYADLENFKLKDLTDENGLLVAESEVRDYNNNKKVNEKDKSVRDYGLGTIFKYNKFKTYRLLKGTYNKEDYYNSSTGKIEQRPISEDFEIPIQGSETDINVIDKVLCFAGEAEFSYNTEPVKIGSFTETESTSEQDPSYKILKGYAEAEVEETNDKGEKQVVTKKIPLYKYRNIEDPNAGVLEVKPVPVEMKKDDKGLRYLYDYLRYFNAYMPEDTRKIFDLEGKIDYESKVFEENNSNIPTEEAPNGGLVQNDPNQSINPSTENNPSSNLEVHGADFQVGSAITSSKLKNTMQYFPIFEKYGKEFGVDPYVLVAMVAQESGGNANLNKDGLVQINFAAGHSISATDASGNKQHLNITNADKKNPDISIKWMAMFMKNNLDMHNGDVLKAIQTYNFGSGTMNRLKKMFPEAWEDGSWTNPKYLEQVRSAQFPGTKAATYRCAVELKKSSNRIAGDICYLPNVLQYYAGNNKDFQEKFKNQSPLAKFKSFLGGVNIKFTNLVESMIPKRDSDEYPIIEYKLNIYEDKVNDIRKEAKALDDTLLFSQVDLSSTSLWDEGFLTGMAMNINGDGEGGFSAFANQGGWLPPLDDKNPRISSPFGWRVHPVKKIRKFHSGVDLPKPTGTPVYASKAGKVMNAGSKGNGLGIYVMIDHGGGYQTIYGHLSAVSVKTGDTVQAGQRVGSVGSTGMSTGPHLHFEVRFNGKPIDGTDIVLGKAIEKRANPIDSLPKDASAVAKLEAVGRSVIGSPYVYGSKGPTSFDCSGFTSYVYRNALGIDIGRSTTDQINRGPHISRENLAPGDLVFFNTVGRNSHVGIYLGNGNFIHSGSSTGVIVKNLNDGYYRSRFSTGVRIN